MIRKCLPLIYPLVFILASITWFINQRFIFTNIYSSVHQILLLVRLGSLFRSWEKIEEQSHLIGYETSSYIANDKCIHHQSNSNKGNEIPLSHYVSPICAKTIKHLTDIDDKSKVEFCGGSIIEVKNPLFIHSSGDDILWKCEDNDCIMNLTGNQVTFFPSKKIRLQGISFIEGSSEHDGAVNIISSTNIKNTSVEVNQCQFESNHAKRGGLYIKSGTVQVNKCKFNSKKGISGLGDGVSISSNDFISVVDCIFIREGKYNSTVTSKSGTSTEVNVSSKFELII